MPYKDSEKAKEYNRKKARAHYWKNRTAILARQKGCPRRKAFFKRHNASAKAREDKREFIAAHPLYHIYKGMKQRCLNPNHIYYDNYGGRGIGIYPLWIESLEAFEKDILEHLGPRAEGYTLDRIDPDGDYEISNLRWATPKEQQNNRRNNKARRAQIVQELQLAA